jgi:hypothetical protein
VARKAGRTVVPEGATRMMMKKKAKGKVVKFTARRREATDLVKFIDAHGGKLGAFRATGRRRASRSSRPATFPKA